MVGPKLRPISCLAKGEAKRVRDPCATRLPDRDLGIGKAPTPTPVRFSVSLAGRYRTTVSVLVTETRTQLTARVSPVVVFTTLAVGIKDSILTEENGTKRACR